MHDKNGEYTNQLYTHGALAQSFQSFESDRIRKPSLYNKEFDRRTADVILDS
jgi:hypothetical protein